MLLFFDKEAPIGYPTSVMKTRNPLLVLGSAGLMAIMALFPIGTRAAQEPIQDSCRELVLNGSFEEDGGWRLEVTTSPATVLETESAFSGERALATGLAPEDAHQLSYSVAQQNIVLPEELTQATLTLGILPQTPATGNDRNYVLIQSPSGNIIAVALYSIVEGNEWQILTRDLPALLDYAGQEVVLQIGVYNDGLGEKAQMLVDDVSLVVCGPVTAVTTRAPTETAPDTATPTATAAPEVPASATPTASAPATIAATATPTAPQPTATASPTAPHTATAAPTTQPPTATPTVVVTAPGRPSPTATTEQPVSPRTTPATALPEPPDRSSGLASIDSAPILLGVALSAVLVLAVLVISTRRPGR
jgi:hypothetical protein